MLMEGVILYVTLVRVFIVNKKRYLAAFTIISYGGLGVYMDGLILKVLATV